MKDAFAVQDVSARDCYPLRRAVLRSGDPDAVVAWDEDDTPGAFHLGCVDESSELVAVASFSEQRVPERPEAAAWRLRGMAVTASRQGCGLGNALLNAAEQRLSDLGADVLWCNARVTAVGFYAKAGFVAVSDIFTTDETGLAHQKMLLDLPVSSPTRP